MKIANTNANNVSLWYLFLRFLKIGSVSFGGFMSLIAVVRDQFVNKDQTLDDEELLDGISIASVLPGPVAVNVVAYVGNKLRGIPGALVSMLGVLIPSVILISGLSYAYFEYGHLVQVNKAFAGILPAVCAIIVVTAIRMSKKNLKTWLQWVILVVAAATLVFFKSFWVTLGIIGGGAILGILLFRKKEETNDQISAHAASLKKAGIGIGIIISLLIGIYVALMLIPGFGAGLKELYSTMSGMSIALFGGGYVFLPVMQQLVVDNFGWLTNQEFVDGIAMGQITPGPIMITATFIGYKTHGFLGAAVATIGMFMPPATLMLIVSSFFSQIKNHPLVKAAFMGMRPAVIGMIFVASYVIAQATEVYWESIAIFIAALGIGLFTKTQMIFTIIGAAVLGILVF